MPPGVLSLRLEQQKGALDLLLGARTRFIIGALLMAACLVWMKQNGMLPGARFKSVIEHGDGGAAAGLVGDIARTSKEQTAPLKLPLLPKGVAARLFNSFNPALAGLLLIVSTLVPGPRIALFVVPAAAIVMVGHVLGLPSVGSIRGEYMSMAVGGALAGGPGRVAAPSRGSREAAGQWQTRRWFVRRTRRRRPSWCRSSAR